MISKAGFKQAPPHWIIKQRTNLAHAKLASFRIINHKLKKAIEIKVTIDIHVDADCLQCIHVWAWLSSWLLDLGKSFFWNQGIFWETGLFVAYLFYSHVVLGQTSSQISENNCIAKMGVGCLRHPGASTIGSQLQDEDCSQGWQILATQPWAPSQ